MSQENENLKSEIEKYSSSLELHNLHYYKELLLTNISLSSKELAILGLLSELDIHLIQFEQLHRYYELYILNVLEVCPPLNNLKLCGKMYSTVVRHLYRKCRCETILAYLQSFITSPCTKYFQCKVATHLHDLDSFGVMHLLQDESYYIDIILGSHCTRNKGYRINKNKRHHNIPIINSRHMSGLSFKRISKVERFISGARSISNFVYKLCTSSVLPTSELERCSLQKKHCQ